MLNIFYEKVMPSNQLFTQLQALMSQEFEDVNGIINQSVQSNIEIADKLSNHIMSRGKRIRPMLILLVCKALNYSGKENITAAALIEIFHTATLLHDDVVDESLLRRGKETANNIWGNKASILVADLYFTKYMQLLVSLGNLEIMKILTDMAFHITSSELQQLSNRHNIDISIEQYYDVIKGKTSLLFSSCTEIAAILSHATSEQQLQLAQFGLHFGNAFQLVDDALDYCADSKITGKNIGDDLSDGKLTMPLIYALQNGTIAQQNIIREGFKTNNFPSVVTVINETNAIEYTLDIARSEINKAVEKLACLANSKYKQALIELSYFIADRDH